MAADENTTREEQDNSDIEESAIRRAVAAGAIGNALEWFDFGVYGYFTIIIGDEFFRPIIRRRICWARSPYLLLPLLHVPSAVLFSAPSGTRSAGARCWW